MLIQEIGTDFPDCIVRRDNGRAWEELAVEFEWDSRSFNWLPCCLVGMSESRCRISRMAPETIPCQPLHGV